MAYRYKSKGDNCLIVAIELIMSFGFGVSIAQMQVLPGWLFFLIAGVITSAAIVMGSSMRVSKFVLHLFLLAVVVNIVMAFDYYWSVYTVIDMYYEYIMQLIVVLSLLIAWFTDARNNHNNTHLSNLVRKCKGNKERIYL